MTIEERKKKAYHFDLITPATLKKKIQSPGGEKGEKDAMLSIKKKNTKAGLDEGSEVKSAARRKKRAIAMNAAEKGEKPFLVIKKESCRTG